MQGEFFKNETVDKIAKLQRENKRLKENCDETLINHLREIVNEEHRILNGMLREENEKLKELYRRTCKHLFDIGNDELARYFQAQISECNVFITQGKSDE